MKKDMAIKIVSMILLLGFVSCGGGGDEPTPPKPPTPPKLTVPKISSPQEGAVCQGTLGSDGDYTVSVSSSTVYGATDYVFSLWDSSGALVEMKKASRGKVSFAKVEAGKSYTVGVKVSNSADAKESAKVSFSTPGAKVVNYIPVVKQATYTKETASLTLAFYDADNSDKELFYSIVSSTISDFDDKKIIKDNAKAENNKSLTVDNVEIKANTYIKITVKDKIGNTSTYTLYIEV